jgi:hypothetical protein
MKTFRMLVALVATSAFVGGCNKRNSEEVKSAIAAAAAAEAAGDRGAIKKALDTISAELRTPDEVAKINAITEAIESASVATLAEASGDRAGMQKALESIPPNLRTPDEKRKIDQLADINAAIVAITAAEAVGDRAAMQKFLEKIPEKLRSKDEIQRFAQLVAVELAQSQIAAAKKQGDRRGLKKVVESVKRLRLPVTLDEDADLALAVAGVALESELELARQKSDVDGLFLVLGKIERSSFLSPEEAELRAKCGQALQEIQALRSHLANHDHEAVVQSADRILELFPNNVEARKALSESGLIFAYLEGATEALSGIIGAGNADAGVAATKTKENLPEKISKLAAADKYLSEALKLDPQYTHSIAIQASVNAAQAVLAVALADALVPVASTVMDQAETISVKTFNFVNTLGRSPTYPKSYWEIYNEKFKEISGGLLKKQRELIAAQANQIAILKQLRNRDNADFVDQTVRLLESAEKVVTGFLEPNGKWSDYSAAITSSQALMKEVRFKYTASQKTFETVAAKSVDSLRAVFTIPYFRDASRTKPILQKRNELINRKIYL